jgi:cyclopropane-fatty-acyl-phospholipid synthase
MMFGRNAPPREAFSFQAPRGSPEYIGAVAMAFFPGSWLPSGEEQILRTATPFFRLVDAKNGRLDYVRTIAAWSRMWSFTWGNFAPGRFSAPRLVAVSKLVPRFLTDADFRRRTEFLRKGYDRICFQDELIDHQRLVFEKL